MSVINTRSILVWVPIYRYHYRPITSILIWNTFLHFWSLWNERYGKLTMKGTCDQDLERSSRHAIKDFVDRSEGSDDGRSHSAVVFHGGGRQRRWDCCRWSRETLTVHVEPQLSHCVSVFTHHSSWVSGPTAAGAEKILQSNGPDTLENCARSDPYKQKQKCRPELVTVEIWLILQTTGFFIFRVKKRVKFTWGNWQQLNLFYISRVYAICRLRPCFDIANFSQKIGHFGNDHVTPCCK